MGNLIQVLRSTTVTASGSQVCDGGLSRETVLFWRVDGTVSGTSPQLQITISELDPNDLQTTTGRSASTSLITSAGSGSVKLTDVTSSALLVSWTVTGAGASFGDVSIGLVCRDSLPLDTYNVLSVTASTSGDTQLVAPASGKSIRLHYLALNADASNSAAVTAALKFGSGALIFKLSLSAGSLFGRNIGAGRRYIQGAVNEALSLNLSGSETVNATIEYEEV
jgi:hypothetical protein